jgi:hypothetical protein
MELKIRHEKLVRLTCDWLEGKYVLPNGKTTHEGQKLNKSELLRASDFPATYKNAYTIFDKETFKADIVTEQARRKDIDASCPEVRLDGEDDNDLMSRLIDRELLYRLRYAPASIDMKDLLSAKTAIAKRKPMGGGGGEEGDGKKKRPRQLFNVEQLVVMLDGRIPQEALDKLPKALPEAEGEVIEGEAEESAW